MTLEKKGERERGKNGGSMSVVLFVLPFYVDRTQKIVPRMGVVLKRIIRSRAMVKKKRSEWGNLG